MLLTEIMATALEDPLIDWKGEQIIIIFVWVLLIAIATGVGLFSRSIEYALAVAFVSSIITIAFFLIP
jgi:membrane protein YdbS with pleckstrin-like domain